LEVDFGDQEEEKAYYDQLIKDIELIADYVKFKEIQEKKEADQMADKEIKIEDEVDVEVAKLAAMKLWD
jgi:hypothetical protein